MSSKIRIFFSLHKWFKISLFITSFVFLWLYLSNFSSQINNKKVFDYQAEIFADRAGYYMYLPATIIYGFKASEFPKGVDEKTGDGFKLDSVGNKVRTKYTCGIAILAAPFFIANHVYQKTIGEPATGFTKSYFKTVNYAAVFYLMIGMIFLFLFLKTRFKIKYIIIALLTLFFTTNLYYYSVIHTFMSHVYTFSMLSIFLWSFYKYRTTQKIKYLIFLSLASGFVILIRPINILFLGLCLFIDIQSFKELKDRALILAKPVNIILLVSIVFLVLLPQLLYYKYLSGSFIFYSYGNEGFTNLFAPKIKEVLFSPNNGLLLYTPIYILFVIGSIIQIVKKEVNGYFVLLSFLLMVLVTASWHCWSFGCSYSMRPFVDILPILAISLTSFFKRAIELKSIIVGFVLVLFVSYLSYANVRFSYSYAGCFMGSEWEWKEYQRMMEKNKIFPFDTKFYKSHFSEKHKVPVKIMTSGNHFLFTGENDILVKSDSNLPKNAESFNLLKIDDNRISIINGKGKYVSSDLGMDGVCIANRDEIGHWEKFVVHSFQDGSLVLNNSVGLFLVVDSLHKNRLVAKTNSIDSATHFRFINQKK